MIPFPSWLDFICATSFWAGSLPAPLEVIAHTQGTTAYFTAQNSLATAQLKVTGQTQLHDNFDTRANAVLTNLNVAPFLRAFHVQRSAAIRRLGARSMWPARYASRSSSAGTRRSLSSRATLQGIALQAEGPIRASLREGVLHLNQAHITGPDTNLSLTGTANLMGTQALDVTGNGSVNMKLAQTFDPDITSSGHVDFNVEAGGTLTSPRFRDGCTSPMWLWPSMICPTASAN